MWSKNFSPVSTCDSPLPSRSMATRMSVSRVLRWISAVRAPALKNCQIRSQSSVISTQLSSSPCSANKARPLSVGCSRIPFAPRLRASSMSVGRSPITKEFAISYSPLRYLPNMPVRGLRVGALSAGIERSIRMSSNRTPSPSKVFSIRLCAGQNVSSGNESVPSPS